MPATQILRVPRSAQHRETTWRALVRFSATAFFGRRIPGLLTGANRYTDDLVVEGETQVVFVRSSMAHAVLRSVDTADAEAMPGVVAVLTAEGLDGANEGIPDFHAFEPLAAIFDRPPLARGRVRFVGDIVAAVVAETREQGVDAAEAVVVDYDPLPAVVDVEAAVADGAPVVWEENGSNVCFETAHGAEDDPLEGADVVVRQRIVSQRLAGVPMEPNAFLAIPESDGTLTAYVSSQNPHGVRDALAGMLGLEPDQVRMIAPWVGGGFGPKVGLYMEYLITSVAARRLGRPVRWTETRSEDMVSLVHGRAMVMDVSLGLRTDGTFVGLNADVLADTGAYPAIGAFLPFLTQLMSQAVYRMPKIRFQARSVVTNTTTSPPTGAPGGPRPRRWSSGSSTSPPTRWASIPTELRRMNFLAPEDFPLTTITGANYDSGEYAKALDAALEASGYAELRAEQDRRRARRRHATCSASGSPPTSRSRRPSASTPSTGPSR